ncbi:acyl-CoA synthetase FdrA [Anaerorhabdus sp.]|uniref:acyl-CoA synthetase FdrA n=1 Tax=Anaerorhabdus sp. TaxID=1872524 RepID=UPI002FC86A6A
MEIKGIIKRNSYYDSVMLMQISRTVEAIDGVLKAMVCMGTDMNKELLKEANLLNEENKAAAPSDVIIAFTSETVDVEEIEKIVNDLLNAKKEDSNEVEANPTSIGNAIKRDPKNNIVVISVAGEYAADEARKALNKGLHVMLFSDNISIEDEIELKKTAHDKGLLVMGPDCGTAIINNVGLCFANQLKKGSIGVIGASGTGTQEITVLIDKLGSGVSQVIGTGGRDLTKEVGGIMMLDSIEALDKDENTKTIVVISKPPVKEVADKIIRRAKESDKDIIICFLGHNFDESADGKIKFASNLTEAAEKAVSVNTETEKRLAVKEVNVEELVKKLNTKQKYVRGLYCGGTICDETSQLFQSKLNEKTYSNVGKVNRLENPYESKMNSFIDLGDDNFTVGKPHPMIEPSLRNERIIQESKDEEVAVILLDVEIGYGSHEDPAGIVVEAIKEAKVYCQSVNKEIIFVAYVLGTKADKQNFEAQVERLENEGVIVTNSNYHAAKLCMDIVEDRYE